MDVVSHAIIGRMIVTRKKHSRKDMFLSAIFAVSPDLFQIPLYIFLGYINNRPYYWPENSDWIGFRSAYPNWVLLWDIPHSLFFLLLVVVPLVYLLRLNKIVILAYFSHLFVDLFTHTGEWGVKPLFPLNYMVNGFTDVWAWPVQHLAVSWVVLLLLVYVVEKIRERRS